MAFPLFIPMTGFAGKVSQRWGGCRSPLTASRCAKLVVSKHKLKEKVRCPPCAHHCLCWWHSDVPQMGIAWHAAGDRPRGALAPCLGLREVRPKPHPKGSYSETITTSSPSISSAGTAPKDPSPAWKTTIETMSVAAREAAKA